MANNVTRPLLCAVGLMVIAALGTWQLVTGDTMVRQWIRMRSARQHQATLQSVLLDDPDLAKVSCETWGGAGGSLLLSGEVPDRAVFDRIRSAVTMTRPPVTVVYRIRSDREVFFDSTQVR